MRIACVLAIGLTLAAGTFAQDIVRLTEAVKAQAEGDRFMGSLSKVLSLRWRTPSGEAPQKSAEPTSLAAVERVRILAPMKRAFLPVVSFAAILAFVAGCYTVPETGRRSLILLPIEQEVALGASSFTELKSQKRISSDPDMNAAVQRIGPRIARAVGDALPDAKWEFVVFDDDTPNAFALPGGKVGVHSGLFKVAQTDDELAVVMGHEIAHVTARHGAERMTQAGLVAAGGVALDAAMRDKDSKERNLALASYGILATGGIILPFSRLNESEADNIGIRYAARAGYDPRAAVTFWKRMKEASEGKGKPPEWLSTHPSDDTRIKNLEKLMPQAMEEYEKSLKV